MAYNYKYPPQQHGQPAMHDCSQQQYQGQTATGYAPAQYQYGQQPLQAPSIPLKPMYTVSSTSLDPSQADYSPLTPNTPTDPQLLRLSAQDSKIKNNVRVLRLVSRVLATILSAAPLAPLAMTIYKFLRTKDTYFTVNGQKRTAWAQDTHTIFTYVYFSAALVSFLFDLGVLLAYFRGVKKANAAAQVGKWWHKGLLVMEVCVWVGTAAYYRYGKVPVDGKFRDLWGWTCSHQAKELQAVITNVNFARYCTIQTSSFYSGIAKVLTLLLTRMLYIGVLMRLRSKKKLAGAMAYQADEAKEPLRASG
ncbi:hypothetical protein LTR78_002919 [Recurvomyces mirabilis]|uniref:Uncharacterized protein n=1 Tax=Recurvomyces mirabilis TaxID=574656 RepID=A0AAE0WT35_9PEZI|nr:hypothetical protein LTR78_002919 [Recurvomyces mirabilis]KAK5159347.1 hypothetical protein LTS14_002489 [Recurvomyces mirabilis]